jgi:Xaa-Pro aminopeptidase
MKTLPVSHYIEARKELARSLPENSILILAGNTEIERTKDVPYPFRQSNNFLYLAGVNQPDVYLVITPDSEQLFIKQLHPFMAVWEGRSNKIDALKKISGIQNIVEYKETVELLKDVLKKTRTLIYLDTPDSVEAQPAAWYLWRQIQDNYPGVEIASINKQVDDLRAIKSAEEVILIQEAVNETHIALDHIVPLLEPGVTEREIAAEFVRFASVKGLEQAWPPIVSFGKNSCVIHHTPDQTTLKAGDLVLFDVGLEVGGYASDISRTLQIGEGSERQNQVRQAVLDVQTESIKLMKPGIRFDEFERQSAQIMAAKLVDLGLFKSIEEANAVDGDLGWPAYRTYFSHYTSHYLGLDAHDVGDREAEFVPGMVLTCEPGIYIAEEGIGVRIEDDILITVEGNEILSAAPNHQ